MGNHHADPARGHASNANREAKARAILSTVKAFSPVPLETSVWLDVGCGSGGIAAAIAPSVAHITGLDPSPWDDWQQHLSLHSNLAFNIGALEIHSPPAYQYDVIVCNQVYEHTDNPGQLIDAIYLHLRSGGICYFAGPNLLFPIEPHVFLPFVHWLPRRLAVNMMRFFGSKGVLDANSTHYWQLRRWFRKFDVHDAIPFILRKNSLYRKNSWFGTGLIWRVLAALPEFAIHALTPLSPGFVFILRKPAE
jgi:2-polyprenyl-3-methyl-5-hydroxy-6-metoxy-1,4-benzoquinol methylase